jgi:polysaccharide export outer membrane protein
VKRELRQLGKGWAIALLLVISTIPALAKQEPPASAKAAPGPPSTSGDYVIAPGDVLSVFVWKEPELTRDLSVRIDGKITVPLLGDVQAAGRTPSQLGADLMKAFSRFLASPQVSLGVSQANSSRFYVIGLVGKSGDYPLNGRLTVLQGLALAGGFREFAKSGGILIIRHENGVQKFIPVNYKKLESAQDLSQNVVLQPGDTIVVP